MGIANALDSAIDWLGEGHPIWSLTKMFVAAALGVGLIANPIVYTAGQNARALESRIEQIDAGPSVTFNSIGDCVARGYAPDSCEASRAEAERIAGDLGTSLKYSSKDQCAVNHGDCTEQVTRGVILVNKVMIPTTNYSYHPEIVGWQASSGDLGLAVPLYRSNRDGVALRYDGNSIVSFNFGN